MACECISRVSEKLEARNTLLITVFTSTDGPEKATLWTEKKERRRDGKKPTRVIAAFCPFCGVKY